MYPSSTNSCINSPKNIPGLLLYTIIALAPYFDAFFSLSEKKTSSSSVSPPLSARRIVSFTFRFSKSLSLLYSPNLISAIIGDLILSVPTMGNTSNCFSLISSVETRLFATLLYVAPTVIAFGLLAGLPIVLLSGPLFPAAATTTIPASTAVFTALSISLSVLFTPRLMLIISALSIIA